MKPPEERPASGWRAATRRLIPVAALLVATTGCVDALDRMEENHSAAVVESEKRLRSDALIADGAVALPAPPAEAQGMQNASDAMLIRTGSARMEVDSLEPAVARVEALAGRVGGSIVNSAIQTGERREREASLSLRIPAARFDEAVRGLTPVGRLESLHVNSEDVGEEFVDLAARLASARQLEERLLEILRTRTGKLEDVLAVERELARVRAEIERYEGRIRYLRSRTEMSVLMVSLHEPLSVHATPPGETVLGRAFAQAWRNFVAFLATGIAALGFLIPVSAVAGGVFVLIRRQRRTAAGVPASAPTA